MSKIIVNFDGKEGDNNNNPSSQIFCLRNLLLMSIVENNEMHLSHVEGKSDTRKVRTS